MAWDDVGCPSGGSGFWNLICNLVLPVTSVALGRWLHVPRSQVPYLSSRIVSKTK